MSKINGPFWVVTYKTESGDEGFYGVFNEEPTDAHFLAFALEDFSEEVIEEEDDEGVITRTLYIYFRAHEVESITDLPDPVED
ncbi:hypothetical protein HOU02_gp104 [Caulobacter phage CcrBL9]|uniref:Uncharacterized protein n=1 Tax=Caulobacter phage CcrBL9 TaxID=2283270 RepID=A0A385EEE2_9CAUD|nr:hypothetical protein HOU02_gp104 [Caulobacter phage CcrBL9]AXQ69128.1 hypothetical protein CcrBL9_gp104 [Caulobacter phage CcrBL9]